MLYKTITASVIKKKSDKIHKRKLGSILENVKILSILKNEKKHEKNKYF